MGLGGFIKDVANNATPAGIMGQMAGGNYGDFVGNVLTGGGMASAKAQADANAMNVQLARENTAFQERMSNTSYQRAVKDMEAAGLNKMVAYTQGGASVPSGVAGHVDPVDKGQIYRGAIGQIEKAAQVSNTYSASRLNQASTAKMDVDANLSKQMIKNKESEQYKTDSENVKAVVQTGLMRKQQKLVDEEKRVASARARIMENEASVSDVATKHKKNVAPYLPYIRVMKEGLDTTAKGVSVLRQRGRSMPEGYDSYLNTGTGDVMPGVVE